MISEKRILVVDDLETNLILVRHILEKSHPEYKILLASSGEEGFQLAQSQLPEAILLDIYMPGMNGFETCQKIKLNGSTSHIPILMISASGYSSEVRTEGLKIGADAFISKPFEKEEFVALVNVLLRIKEAEDKLRTKNQELEIYIRQQIKEFHQTEERFLQISGYALEFYWEVTPDGIFSYVSPAVEDILGYKPEVIIDKMHFFQLASERLIDAFDKKKKCNFKDVECFKEDRLEFHHREGKVVWMSVCAFPLIDSKNELICYRGACQNVSDKVKAEMDLQKSFMTIKEYQGKLKKMNSELSIAEERERRRIAEYLHDGIGQILSITNIKLSSLLNSEQLCKVDRTEKTIRESIDLIKNAILETKSLTYDLSPPILYELGLIPAIKWKLEQIENKYGVITKTISNISHLKINVDTRALLYRIVSELLANIIKHAGASLIKVEIKSDQDILYISVSDNGKGFDYDSEMQSAENSGFGLFSIRERLDSIQGSLMFESDLQIGTNAIVKIPLLE